MIDRLEPKQKAEPTLDSLIQGVLSPSGIGDMTNNFQKIRVRLEIPEFWQKVKQAQTCDEYIREKYETRPDIAEGVIHGIDNEFRVQYDEFAKKVNEAIGVGVTTEAQSQTIDAILTDAQNFIREYCKKLG